jgi:hypothetical protein
MVPHPGGGVVAVYAACVERDFYPIATVGAAARGLEPRKAPTIHDPITINRLQAASADLAADCYRLLLHRTDCFYCASSRAQRPPTFRS